MPNTCALIPKPGNGYSKTESYKLISLLNIAYKIFTSSSATRLNSFPGNDIHNDQMGFLKQSYTNNSIHRRMNLIDFAQINLFFLMMLMHLIGWIRIFLKIYCTST